MSRASRLLLVASFACLIALAIARPASATGGTIETPTSSTVSQPIVISGWAVAFRCPTAPPGAGYECTADGSWYPPGHAFYTAAGTFVGCTGTPPSSPPQVCFWYSPWIAASSSLAIQQAGNPADGTGVDVVEIWTCPGTTCTSSNKVLQGTATYGQPRSDVATLLGSSRFTNSGYSFTLSTLTPGQYVVRVRMHSAIYDNWNTTSKTITVVAATTHPVMGLDALVSNGASVSQPFAFSGWAIDTAAPTGTGVDTVAVNAWHNPGSGQPAFNWAPITLGGSRPAVGSTYGSQFTNSGYTTTVTGYPAGVYYPVAFMRSTLTSMWTLTTSTLYVDATTFALTIDRQGSGTGGVSASGLSCAGGASTQALPCGATYPVNTVVTLTPQADTGSTFLGWAGACSGTGACQLTLSTARLAAAIFSKTPTSSDVSYYHTDAIGSVRAITDAAGATVIRHDYGAFGEDTQPLTGDPQRFGGMQLDPESALNYAGARYYRVSWGRFTQVDPLGGSLTNPQRWNGYAYALNNPLRYVDPMGMVASWTQAGDPCAMHGLEDSSCYDGEAYSCWANGCNTPGQMSEMQQMAEAYYGMTDSQAAAYNGTTPPKNTPSAETLPEGTVTTTEVFEGVDSCDSLCEVLDKAGAMSDTGVKAALVVASPNLALVGATFLPLSSSITSLGNITSMLPKSLFEQLLFQEAADKGIRIMQGRINDPSYPENLYAKMEYVHTALNTGVATVVHYWNEIATSVTNGFKIK